MGTGAAGCARLPARCRSRLALDCPHLGAVGRDVACTQCLRPSPSSPTDGIVLEKAQEIVGPRTAPLEKARAIYDWVVDNTFRRPDTRGCGHGNVAFMLRSGDLGGKCADI